MSDTKHELKALASTLNKSGYKKISERIMSIANEFSLSNKLQREIANKGITADDDLSDKLRDALRASGIMFGSNGSFAMAASVDGVAQGLSGAMSRIRNLLGKGHRRIDDVGVQYMVKLDLYIPENHPGEVDGDLDKVLPTPHTKEERIKAYESESRADKLGRGAKMSMMLSITERLEELDKEAFLTSKQEEEKKRLENKLLELDQADFGRDAANPNESVSWTDPSSTYGKAIGQMDLDYTGMNKEEQRSVCLERVEDLIEGALQVINGHQFYVYQDFKKRMGEKKGANINVKYTAPEVVEGSKKVNIVDDEPGVDIYRKIPTTFLGALSGKKDSKLKYCHVRVEFLALSEFSAS